MRIGDGDQKPEGRHLPPEMYNFYDMDQYRTQIARLQVQEEAAHKDFDIWIQEFDKQVKPPDYFDISWLL